VADAGKARRLEQTHRTHLIHFAGPAKGARGAVDYGVDAAYCWFQTFPRQQVSVHCLGLRAMAQDPRLDARGVEEIHHAPAEHTRSSRDEDLLSHPASSFRISSN
jgi:hypothetical protein